MDLQVRHEARQPADACAVFRVFCGARARAQRLL